MSEENEEETGAEEVEELAESDEVSTYTVLYCFGMTIRGKHVGVLEDVEIEGELTEEEERAVQLGWLQTK